MKSFNVQIQFVTDYLQARFTEDAKKEVENFVSKGIVKSTEDSWVVLLHQDDKGVFIPAIQVRNSLIASGKEFKLKKQRRSLQQWAISNLIVEPEQIYLGKQKPDRVVVSYPARKDGNRVVIKHPAFERGLKVEFVLKSLDDTMEDKAISELIAMAGKMYGIGARRRDMFGRFELIKFEAKPI